MLQQFKENETMIQTIKKNMIKAIRLLNRVLNRKTIRNKVFCIGLHKTGTTTLANYLNEFGFNTTHTTNWINDDSQLEKYDFFSDGGSHFDHQNEFDYQRLFHTYKHSKFILQTRDTERWIISKLKHSGWKQDTVIQKDDLEKITHNQWKYKSILTIQKFIEHKFNYERKVLSFFKEKDFSRLLVVDITQEDQQKIESSKLREYLNLKSMNKISLPHSNKGSSGIAVTKEAIEAIKQILANYNDNTQ